ncbi:MAG: aminopeptidase P family protein [Acidobacteria bacterium]|nr:aminopeptidase P family protein [Acidobacteriota bacterium]
MPSRLERIREKIDEAGAVALLVGSRANVRYLSGFSGSSGAILVTKGAATLFTDSRYTIQAGEEWTGGTVETVTGAPLRAALRAAGAVRVAFEAAHVTVAEREDLEAAATGARLVATRGLVEGHRSVKEPEEIRRIESAVRVNAEAFDAGVAEIAGGVTEARVAAVIEGTMRERGAESPAFDSIVASGPRGALPHARASMRRLVAGEPVVVDIGAKVDGYTSDMTRTVFLGEPGDLGRRVHAAVLEGVRRAEGLVRHGASIAAVDGAARDAVAEAGFADAAFRHGTGHGVGIEVHEAPHVGRAADGALLAAGMVVTIEPGIYIEGWGGVRIEDIVVVERDGCRVLTTTPKEMLIV